MLTAGHCVQSNVASQYTIRIGEYNLFQPDVNHHRIDYAVSKIILHTNYTGLTNKRKSVKNADIALVRSKHPIVFGDFAWPICYFDSEEEEKEGLLELKRASKILKKNPSKELNYQNDFVEHQLTDEELLEDGYFSILDESNCESYSQTDYYQSLSGTNQPPSNFILDSMAAKHLNALNRTGSNRLPVADVFRDGKPVEKIEAQLDKQSDEQLEEKLDEKLSTDQPTDRSTVNSTIQTIKYRSNFVHLISDDSSANRINLNATGLSSLANLAIVVGWGNKGLEVDPIDLSCQILHLIDCLSPIEQAKDRRKPITIRPICRRARFV